MFGLAVVSVGRNLSRQLKKPNSQIASFSSSSSTSLPIVHLYPPINRDMSKPQEVNFERTVGHRDEDQPVSWNRRDLILYSVGIGAKENDLLYTYELQKGFKAFPTYPLVLAHKGNNQDTTIFAEMVAARSGIPGFPALDPNTIVHGEQSIEILAPIPIVSTPGWKLKKRVVGVKDTKSGLIIENELRLVSPTGHTHCIMIGSAFYRGGGQGTGFSKQICSKPPVTKAPATEPTYSITEKTTASQALLYRLSGDYNPLHIDPAIGKKGGLGGTILHGLCSFGHAARAVLRSVAAKDGQPGEDQAELLAFSARFTSPVKPGDSLKTNVWITGESNGEIEIAFEQEVVGGKKSLGGGYAKVRRAGKGNLESKL